MMWYHNVAPAAAAVPSYQGGTELQPKSPKDRGRMEKYPQPQQSSYTGPPWKAPTPNPASFPILL